MRRETQSTRALLQAGVAALNLELPEPAQERMLRYIAELRKWNQAYNLTAIRDPASMVAKHLLDSLAVLPFLRARTFLDVGSGAGLPGVPLAIARPGLEVTVLDSNGKKARFLRHVQRALAVRNVEVVESRAENFRPEALFDAVISRAFGSLADFLSETAHLGAAGGQWLAMKGKLDEQELRNIPQGFVVKEIVPLKVPGLAEARHLVCAARAGTMA